MSIYKKFLLFGVGFLVLLVGIASAVIELEIVLVLGGLYLIVTSFYGDFNFISKFIIKRNNTLKFDGDSGKENKIDNKKGKVSSSKGGKKSINTKKKEKSSVNNNSKKIPLKSTVKSKKTPVKKKSIKKSK